MAGSAGHVGVAVGQQEASSAVIKLGAEPGIKGGVAGFASGGEFRGHVIGIYRGLKIVQVARHAGGGKASELPDRGVLVALIALQYSVLTQQREAIEVILNRLHRNIPTQRRVALGAIGAKLALVNVGVAIGAVLAYVCENGFPVALGAIHFFVHAAQGIARGVMIKFGNGANRRPAGGGVTVLTRNRQGAVRTPARLSLGVRRIHERER